VTASIALSKRDKQCITIAMAPVVSAKEDTFESFSRNKVMHIPVLTLQRWVFATALVVAVGLFPQQGQAAPPKSDSATPIKSDQATPTKPAQTTSPKQGATAPKLSLGEDSTIRIPVGSADGEVQVMMKAENLTDADVAGAKDPVLKDLGGAGSLPSTKVEFRNPVAIDSGTTTRAWLMIARISKLPANSSQKRSARFSFGKVEQYIDYTVTNLSPAAFTWSVAAPGVPWLVWFGYPDTRRTMTVVVTTGDYPASNLRIAQAILRDGIGTSQIALEDLELCESATGPCGHFNINARTSRTYFVRLNERPWYSNWQNGKYAGTLSFAVNERTELQTSSVNLHISSLLAWMTGAILLGVGIWSAWWTGVWARARLLQLEALKPVAVLHESITALQDELKNIGKKIDADDFWDDGIPSELNEIDSSLTTDELDKKDLLPKTPPNFWPSSTDTSTKLKDYLNTQGEMVSGFTVLVQDGMEKIVKDWKDSSKHAEIKAALRTLNEKGKSVINRAQGEELVRAVLNEYNTLLHRSFDPSGPQVISPPNTQYLSWEIALLNTKGWLMWGAVTFIAGATVLIISIPGFGSLLDLVFCLLWGFGLPTAVDKLQQLTPGKMMTSMSLNLPKANP
jgi:hypothetical protein